MTAATPSPPSQQAPVPPLRHADRSRERWLVAMVLLTAGSPVLTAALAPAGSGSGHAGAGLGALLFLGSSVHVASTAWFATVPQVRRFMGARRGRYLVAPAVLVLGGALLGAVVPQRPFALLLAGFFGWQFFHFQKQNLGLAALTCAAYRAGPLRPGERRAVTSAGVAGIAALLAHPELLQLSGRLPRLDAVFWAAAAGFAVAVGSGVVQLLRRPRAARPWQVGALYLLALGFFLPVFLFSSPYTAVAGLVLAHGLQYLLMMALVAGGADGGDGAGGEGAASSWLPRLISLALLVNIALLLGLLLAAGSHLHDGGPVERALYGAYLGAVAAHFVADAGLWRLRDEFPRAFLGTRLPYLLS